MRIAIFIVMFFVVGALLIISNNNLAMYKDENIPKFSHLYVKWLDNIYTNVRIMTGYVVRLDWLP